MSLGDARALRDVASGLVARGKRPVNTPCVVKRTPTCAEATA
ncbi:hypothetical protein [Pseudomonas corrugata]